MLKVLWTAYYFLKVSFEHDCWMYDDGVSVNSILLFSFLMFYNWKIAFFFDIELHHYLKAKTFSCSGMYLDAICVTLFLLCLSWHYICVNPGAVGCSIWWNIFHIQYTGSHSMPFLLCSRVIWLNQLQLHFLDIKCCSWLHILFNTIN